MTSTKLEQESKDFFCAYGWAVYKSSGIEKGLVQIFAIDAYDPSNPKTIEDIPTIIDKKDTLTLGNLINHAKDKLHLTPKVMILLDNALKQRNWLIHNFYFDAYEKVINKSSRDELIEKLNLMSQGFGELNDLLTMEIIKRMKHKGIPENVLDQLAKEVIDELKG